MDTGPKSDITKKPEEVELVLQKEDEIGIEVDNVELGFGVENQTKTPQTQAVVNDTVVSNPTPQVKKDEVKPEPDKETPILVLDYDEVIKEGFIPKQDKTESGRFFNITLKRKVGEQAA